MKTMPRDNLLGSACLDLFGHINKENIKDLIKHLVETCRDKVMALSYIDTFREILGRYDNSQGFSTNVDPYFLESEDEVGRRPAHAGPRLMMEHLAVDPAQEEYWNTSDDEDEMVAKISEPGVATNGATPKPLVEYSSDEEGEENGEVILGPLPAHAAHGEEAEKAEGAREAEGQRSADSNPQDVSQPPATPPASAAVPPPERLSEKRRREEDEEDELGKIILHKRRNSTSANLNSSAAASPRNKKKGAAGGKDPHSTTGGTKKIAISISANVKAAGAATEEGG